MNIRDRQAIRHAAGQSLENAKGEPRKILLVYLGIVTGLSLAVAALSVVLTGRIENTGGLSNMGLRSVLSTAKAVLPLVQSLVFIGLELGYCTVALRIVRGEHISNDTLFSGFRRFFPLLRAQILLSFLYIGIAMLSIYTGAYLFLMLPMSEGFYETVMPMMESATSGGVMTIDEPLMAATADAMMPSLWLFALLFLLLFLPTYYNYRMVTYRLIDQKRPGALRAIHESRVMMRRNRFALLKLDLTLWWFYLLQTVILLIAYLDMLLPMLGIALPFSSEISYFLFLALSLGLQFVVYYFCMNKVAVIYATAYETLLSKDKPETRETAPVPAANPWQDQY